MAGTWKLKEGTHRVEDGIGFQDDIITFTNSTGSARPTLGQVLADVVTGTVIGNYGTLAATGSDGEPEIVQISVQVKVTKLKDHITLRFRQFFVEV